jgi:hypothetical protein
VHQDRKAFQANGHGGRHVAAGGGLTQLEFLLAVMHHYYEAGELYYSGGSDADRGRWQAACLGTPRPASPVHAKGLCEVG